MSNQELSMLFFLQLAVILLAVRLVGQPQVVGEMIAGVALMAIVTTLMATPMFEWVYGRHWRAGMTLSDPVPATPG